jgi:hypothetical protein
MIIMQYLTAASASIHFFINQFFIKYDIYTA